MFRQSFEKKKGAPHVPVKILFFGGCAQGRKKQMTLEEDLAQYAHNKAGERFAAFEEEAM
jgi:hypothetical protein